MTLGVRLNQDIIFHSRHQPYLIFHFFFLCSLPGKLGMKINHFYCSLLSAKQQKFFEKVRKK